MRQVNQRKRLGRPVKSQLVKNRDYTHGLPAGVFECNRRELHREVGRLGRVDHNCSDLSRSPINVPSSYEAAIHESIVDRLAVQKSQNRRVERYT
jgi:hypothetical protein